MLCRILAFSFLFFALPVGATIIRYDTRAEWEAAVPDFTLDGLESHGVQRTTGGTLDLGDFSFHVPFNHQQVGTCWEIPDESLSCNTVTPPEPRNMILIGDVHQDGEGTFNELQFDRSTRWFAVDVLEVEDEASLEVSVLSDTFAVPKGFFGIVSDEPFEILHIEGNRNAYAVDNVRYQGPIPEPSAAVVFGLGLLIIAWIGSSTGSRPGS